MFNFNSFMGTSGAFDPVSVHRIFPLLIVSMIWSLIWKGWALWLAARRKEKVWFIILLIVNSIGILEIIYIFAIAKQKDSKKQLETSSDNQ